MNTQSSSITPNSHTSTVLVVDESIDTIIQINNTLSCEDYFVLTARDADSISNHLHRTLPDLILIDATSPRLKGFELGRWIKSIPAFWHIPILFMIERANTEQIVASYTYGGNSYITKPLRTSELFDHVSTQIYAAELR